MQKLPIGVQSFTVLRQENYLYVDKTELIYELSNVAKFVFLARPRRFGKSLLTTTLQEIFRGNRALFHGLWIEDKIDWKPRPVLLINFNALDYREQSFAAALTGYMDELAAGHDLQLESIHYKDKFRELIVRLSALEKVALLIDEYDKPITDFLGNEDKVLENVETLKNFFSVLKAPEADHLHFTLLTGVSKYGKISVFSDLNNLLDVTLDRRFATLLGYTQRELEDYFSEYIDRLTVTFGMERAAMLALIARWYNGYSWDGVRTLYVPFSTLVFLEQQTFANHWFSTATPSFLIRLLRQEKVPAYELERVRGGAALMDSADVGSVNIYSLLFQSGYLSVKRVERGLSGEARYVLGYPNYEVAQAFQQHLLADYLDKPADHLASSILLRLEDALRDQNIEAFIGLLRAVFASIPYTLFLPQEAYYHSLVYLLLKLLGFAIHAEPLTNLGRTDAVLELPEAVYVIEFKTQSGQENAQSALQQIRDKGYDLPYRGQERPILLLGIVFDSEKRNIGDWAMEPAP